MQPGLLGLITDVQAHSLPVGGAAFLEDFLVHRGFASARRGWTYNGTTADSSAAIVSINETAFRLNGSTRIMTASGTPDLRIHNPSSAGTQVVLSNAPASVAILYRATYRDEDLYCVQDGITPLVRYSGANFTSSGSEASATWTVDRSTVTGHTLTSDKAAYWRVVQTVGGVLQTPVIYARVLETSTGSQTLENLKASATVAVTDPNPTLPVGGAWAGVTIYDAGTLSITGNVATGRGTKWLSIDYTPSQDDVILLTPSTGTLRAIGYGGDPSTDTSWSLMCPNGTETTYKVMRRAPFKDVAVHRGSLFGTGVDQYRSRVYVLPPGSDIGLPPGVVLPYDPTTEFAKPLDSDYEWQFIPVPSDNDSDANVAILSSHDPLIVLKRRSVWGIYGSYPGFTVNLIRDGIGCLDIRSAISVDEGQFWAGETGVFHHTPSGIRDLTEGRVNQEWRNAVQGFTTITSGVARGHLIVSVEGTTEVTYVFNLRTGAVSTMSNTRATAMHTSRIAGQAEKLLWSGPTLTNGRLADLASCFATDGGVYPDANDSGPTPIVRTGSNIDGGDIITESRLLDVETSTVHTDTDGTPAVLTVRHGRSGGYDNDDGVTATTTIGTVTATTGGVGATTPRRSRHRSDQAGRRHFIQIEAPPATSTQTPPEVHELSGTFRTLRTGT